MRHFAAMNSFYFKKNAEEIAQWAYENGFSGVEIWADVPLCYVDDKDIDTIIDKLVSLNEKIAYTVHSPIYGINISSVNPGILKESIRQIKKAMTWAGRIHIEKFIVHTGRVPARRQYVMQKVRTIIRESMEDIKKEADKNRIDLIIENTGVDRLSYDYDIEEMIDIAREFGTGICLDTGHANISGMGAVLAEEVIEKTEELHLHDNFGEKDEHLPVGDGNIDWSLYRPLMLKQDMITVHEVRLGNNTENEIIRSRKRAEEIAADCFT
ncbi:MAG: sugar phosphate isomerase/epimerase [Elusimicrobiota bacterium]